MSSRTSLPTVSTSTRRSKRVIQSPSSSEDAGPRNPAATRQKPRVNYTEEAVADSEEDDDDDDDDVDNDMDPDQVDEEDLEVDPETEGEEQGGQEDEEEEDGDEEGGEGDGAATGEYESGEDPAGNSASGPSSRVPSQDVDSDDREYSAPAVSISPAVEPRSAVRIKLRFTEPEPSARPARAAAKKAGKRTKRVAEEIALGSDDDMLDEDVPEEDAGDEELDELDPEDTSTRSASPSKMTARQRARGNKDLQETLLALPNDAGGKKIILTEAERLQKREETSRRRKRQSEQKLQDEQDQTINRLLRAQTGRSRAKIEGPSPTDSDSRLPSPSARNRNRHHPGAENTIRWTCSLSSSGDIQVRLAAPVGKERWIGFSPTAKGKQRGLVRGAERAAGSVGAARGGDAGGAGVGVVGGVGVGLKRDASGVCAVEGCGQKRKYRCVRDFGVGGCSMEHLKVVDAGLAVA